MNKNQILRISLIVCAVLLVGAVIMSLTGVWGGIGYRYASAEQYTAGGTTVEGAVRNLDVDWIDGKVTIAYHSEPTVLISETATKDIPDDLKLRWWLDGDTLRVRYARSGAFHLSWNLKKELTLTLPEGAALGDVRLEATSGELIIPALRADSLKLQVTSGEITAAASADTVDSKMTSGDMTLTLSGTVRQVLTSATSGNIRIEADTAEKVQASVTSGRIQVTAAKVGDCKTTATSGTLAVEITDAGTVELKGTSANATIRLGRLDRLDAGVTSGNISAFLPTEPGFRAHVSVTNGRFDTGLALQKEGNDYLCGDGSASVTLRSTSGNIRLDPLP